VYEVGRRRHVGEQIGASLVAALTDDVFTALVAVFANQRVDAPFLAEFLDPGGQ
jgi:hypothetical protein